MSEHKKGNSFKGKTKNKNKKLSKEKRRLKYTKKRSTKEYHTSIVARKGISRFLGDRVDISAEVAFIGKDKPTLLEHVYINDEYVDHIWVEFSNEDLQKLQYCYKQCRILLTGEVNEYIKRNDRHLGIKYGIINPKLLKE
jgi:hypothetical protein